jgi:hypothetical protein
MKKLLTLVFICTVSAMLWLNNRPQHSPSLDREEQITHSPEQILRNDLAKIEIHLDSKVVKSDLWQDVLKYEVTPKELVNSQNVKSIFEVSNNAIGGIHSCLLKDFCGMETRGDFDPYFDEKNTPSHFLLERNLKLMKESLDKDPTLASSIDWDLINQISEDESERTSSAAMDLLAVHFKASEKEEALLKTIGRKTGEAKAKSLLSLSKNATNKTKALLANEVEESFAMADANTVISVLEKLKEMKLTTQLLADVMPRLCRFKESHNWPMIIFEAQKNDFNLQTVCE